MQDPSSPDWRELSALYDQAQALSAGRRAEWLLRLDAQAQPQAAALRKMLAVDADFLAQLPRLTHAGLPHAAHTHAASTQAEAGQAVGGYRLLRPLGDGGMAEVWLAERADGAFERRVALKLLFAQPGLARQQNFRRRFEREHRILASLRHPHIAALHDAGVTALGQHWLALEWVDGVAIDVWCDSQRLGVRQRVALFMQALQAVSHAHARLVLHRDLKPSNVMVTDAGELRLLDFGIATLLDTEGGTRDATELTQAGARPMTPRYASPEQWRGQPLDVTSDVYALGVMLYELLCGALPFALGARGTGELERAILAGDAPAPSRQLAPAGAAAARGLSDRGLRRQLSGELDAIVLRAMACRSEDRYRSVDALAADLAHWLAGEPVLARMPGPAARAWKFARRHPWGVGLGSAAVLALGLLTGVALHNARQADEEAARARAASDFMLRLFDDVDPDRHGGQALTPAQLLVRGRERLVASDSGSALKADLLKGDLLEGIARAQTDMPDADEADVTFAHWIAWCQQHGDAARRAWALTLRAENDKRRQRLPEATRWLAEAQALWPDARASAAQRAKRAEVRGWIANADGRLDDAETAFAEGLAAASSVSSASSAASASPAPTGGAAVSALQVTLLWLARAQNDAERGEAAGALTALDAAAGRIDAALAERPGLRHELAMMRAVVLDNLAQYGRLAREAPADLERCNRELGPGSEICQKLRGKYWRALMRLGQAPRLFAEWPALLRQIDDSRDEPRRMDAVQLAQRVAWQAGDAAARAQVTPRLEALERDAASPVTRLRCAVALADAALHAGQTAQALQHLMRAEQHARAGDVADAYFSAQIQMMQGLAWQAAGQAARAAVALTSAQQGFDGVLGPSHPLALWLGLNRARTLWATGQSALAHTLVDTALPVLTVSLGADAPALARIHDLKRDLKREPLVEPLPGDARPPRYAPFD